MLVPVMQMIPLITEEVNGAIEEASEVKEKAEEEEDYGAIAEASEVKEEAEEEEDYGAIEEASEVKREAEEEEDYGAIEEARKRGTRRAGRSRKRDVQYRKRQLEVLRECKSPGHSDE